MSTSGTVNTPGSGGEVSEAPMKKKSGWLMGAVPKILLIILVTILLNIVLNAIMFVNPELKSYKLMFFNYFAWFFILMVMVVALPQKLDNIFLDKPKQDKEKDKDGEQGIQRHQIFLTLGDIMAAPPTAAATTTAATTTAATTAAAATAAATTAAATTSSTDREKERIKKERERKDDNPVRNAMAKAKAKAKSRANRNWSNVRNIVTEPFKQGNQ